MIGETALVGAINSIIINRKLDKWGRLILSCLASSICTFLFSFGTAGVVHLRMHDPVIVALAYALCEGCIPTAGILLFMWKRSPLTRGMPISVPTGVELAEREILAKQGVSTFENEKK